MCPKCGKRGADCWCPDAAWANEPQIHNDLEFAIGLSDLERRSPTATVDGPSDAQIAQYIKNRFLDATACMDITSLPYPLQDIKRVREAAKKLRQYIKDWPG